MCRMWKRHRHLRKTYSDTCSNILETLGERYRVVSVDAMAEAKKLGNPRVFNTVIIGVAAKNMDFSEEEWLSVIEKTVPPKTVEINQKAFKEGFQI